MYLEVYVSIWRYMKVYDGIWRYMGVRRVRCAGGGCGAPAAASESMPSMPSELYHQGGMRIFITLTTLPTTEPALHTPTFFSTPLTWTFLSPPPLPAPTPTVTNPPPSSTFVQGGGKVRTPSPLLYLLFQRWRDSNPFPPFHL